MKSSGNEDLIILATTIAIALGQGQSADQLSLLSSLFNLIGDVLDIMSLTPTNPESKTGQ